MATPKVRFTTGGTVQAGGGVYLKRSSDDELLQACQEGRYTYVLTSRQMGKSSLMTHAAEQLRSLQIQPLIIDLQAIGIQVTADQWYLGLLAAMEGQLMLDTDILDWWKNHQHLGLTQRFTTFFEQVLLQEISDRIVIFVDEIDTVLSVDFADDFFIAIRYFHQNRAQNPDLYRLSFVLLGVAAPGDLIRNQQRTPFNIGQPIDLRGFTVAEVQPLGAGLAQLLGISEPQALAVLEAVLHWTGGQPFLTQKICQFMTATDSRPAPGEELAWVSALVREKIIDRWEAQDTPPHLSTIRDRLTRSKEKTARLLGLYQNLLEQGDLPADDRPEQVELRLTGLVVKRDGRLQVFNHIYQSVFKRSWVVQALRDLRPYGDSIQEWLSSGRQDESRLLRGQALQEARQWAEGKSLGDDDRLFLDASLEIERREAELRFEAEQEANRILTAARDEAERRLRDAEQRKLEADRAVEEAYQNLAVAQVRITSLAAKEAYASGKPLDALMLSLQAGAQYKALAGNSSCKTQNRCDTYFPVMAALQQSLYGTEKALTLNRFDDKSIVSSVSFSPDGETIASGSEDNTVKLWKWDGTLLKTLDAQGYVSSVSFSPDGEMIATGGNTMKLWKRDGTLLKTLDADYVLSLSFSPDGKTIASGSYDTVKLWRTDGTLLKAIEGQGNVRSVNFSPDGKTMVSGSEDKTAKLWRIDGTLLKTLDAQSYVLSVSFSPDGETIASGIYDKTVKLWRTDGTLLKTLEGHTDLVLSVNFSPDGDTIASGSNDGTVKLWRKDGTLLKTLESDQYSVYSVSFSPNGETIASGGLDTSGLDNRVKLWSKDGILIKTLEGHTGEVNSVSFSPDGETIASSNGTVKLWEQWNNLDRFLAAACYWTADYRQINTDVAVNDLCQRPEIRAELPDFLRTQALETAKKGNYTAALSFAEDLPDRAAIDTQLRTLASAALSEKGIARVRFKKLSDLSEIYKDENSQSFGDALKQFQPLKESRQREGLWLLNRAKTIDPSFDLAQAQQTLEETLRETIDRVVQPFIDRGDEHAKNGNPDQALQQYRYALQIDPTQGFTPESRLQEQQAGSRE